MRRVFLLAFAVALFSAGCSKPESSTETGEVPRSLTDTSTKDPVNPEVDGTVESNAIANPQVLLFNGVGISTSDWQSLEQIIKGMGLSYRLVNSAALTSMTLTQLQAYKLILIPGGNSNVINNGLSLATKIKVRRAVRDGGVSYLGICAGAFAAIGIDSLSNTTAYYGFAVGQGDYLTVWYPNGNTSLLAAMTMVNFADGTRRSLVWWDGPSTPEWKGGVVARYADGKPAISETWTGKGFVIVSGPHPEAPPSWQWDTGKDPDGLDYDIAIKLIHAALNRQPLPAFK